MIVINAAAWGNILSTPIAFTVCNALTKVLTIKWRWQLLMKLEEFKNNMWLSYMISVICRLGHF